jgi:hypothetical protein
MAYGPTPLIRRLRLKELLIIWLALGLGLTLVYLCVCYLIRKGTFGRVLADDFIRQSRMEIRVPVTTVLGIMFPPVMVGLLLYFANRVRRERARIRGYGRLH